MDLALMVVLVPVLLTLISAAFGSGPDTPTWELRWRSLEPADRIRLSSATRSGVEPADPEEANLAAGFERRRRRRSAYIEAPIVFVIVAFTALSLAGLHGGVAGWALATAGIGSALWTFFGEKRLTATLRAVNRPGGGL